MRLPEAPGRLHLRFLSVNLRHCAVIEAEIDLWRGRIDLPGGSEGGAQGAFGPPSDILCPNAIALPEALFPVANRTMALLLCSPLHGLASGSIILLRFSGRHTGKRRATLVRYLRDGPGAGGLPHQPPHRLVAQLPRRSRKRGAAARWQERCRPPQPWSRTTRARRRPCAECCRLFRAMRRTTALRRRGMLRLAPSRPVPPLPRMCCGVRTRQLRARVLRN